MMTQEISAGECAAFFDSFSHLHQGENVSVEILDRQLGSQPIARNVPLMGITVDPKDIRRFRIEVMTGDSPADHATHEIGEPVHVRIARSDDGQDRAVEFEEIGGVTTLVSFGDVDSATTFGR